MKKVYQVVTAIVVLFGTAAFAGEPVNEAAEPTTEQNMDDAQARGYEAALKNEITAAAGWFTKAAEYADRTASWEGLMDASLALSSVGETENAKTFLDRAGELSTQFKDWRTSLAMAHAYASLPEEAEADDEAAAAVDEAKAQAEKLESWRAMVEIGTAYLNVKTEEASNYATDAYDAALQIATEAKDAEGVQILAQKFEDLGEKAKAAEAQKIAEQLPPPKKKRKDRSAPPPGWSPTGKSLAEPREISEASKAIMAQRAARKHAEALELALQKGDVDDQHTYLYQYSRYWASHPDQFNFRAWGRDDLFDTGAWGKRGFSNYHRVNGMYVRIK